MTNKIRVGVAGGRWVGQMHSEALSGIRNVELTALADIDKDVRKEIGGKFGFRATFADYTEMIRTADLDAVVLSLPTFLHYDACKLALRAGCHVLCEKPPACSAVQMKKIASQAKKKGLIYMFGRQSRFDPGVVAARKLVERGTLGNVYHAEASWIRARGPGLTQPSWRLDSQLGGGVLLDLGVHTIDEAWFCMGCPQPVEVSARLYAAFSHFSSNPSSYTADDAAAGLIRFSDGATLSFMTSFALNTPGPEGAIEQRERPEWCTTRLYGTKAGLDVRRGVLITGGPERLKVRPVVTKKQLSNFAMQDREFIRAVNTGATPISSADEAIVLMQILDAARRSGEQGRSVRIRQT